MTVDGACPRCGAARAPDQDYCLECGRPLPDVHGRIPSLRRRWGDRFGWYPGDAFWPVLGLLVVAAVGAGVAATVSHHRVADRAHVITALTPIAEFPTTTTAIGNGGETWPAGRTGWTVVLVSYPANDGRASATAAAKRGAHAGLPNVGVLNSSRYASLQPGYFVVFSGVYDSEDDAKTNVANARGAGFGAPYARQIAG